MQKERKAKRNQKLRTLIYISAAGIIIGALFVTIAFGFDYARLLKGIIAGFMITVTIGILEFFVFINNFKKIKFSVSLLIRIICYVLAISVSVITVWVVHESKLNDAGLLETMQSNDFRYFMFEGDFKKILIFAIVVAVLINFFTQINSLLGKNVLVNYLTGRYHSPKEEERVFMFVDLTSSTTIAEKLGPVSYHKFVNNYFFDIDEAIIESKGEIYQYVGDEVVISWKGNDGYEDSNCIRCFFNIRERIDELSEKYTDVFGIIPGFKAGLHCGQVVTGEIGDSKKEIAFHGDVLNTASRIQNQCNVLNKKFLISEDVLKKIAQSNEFKIETMGKFKLRGKENEIEIYSVEKN